MGRYQAYPEYKDSGVEWVGEIPTSWGVSPLFAVASTSCVKNEDGAENNVLSLSYGRIVKRDVDDNYGLLPESFNTYQLVNKGDLILRLTDLQNDKRSLRVGYSEQIGIITSAYLKLSAKVTVFHDRYLYRLLHSYDTTKVFYGMGGGLRQSMKFDDMRRLQMLVPSYGEQQAIANFLDHETAKIDTLIEQQQQLIQLLKEKRQAVISHAVTKGLNPDAPMKDSGVEWLGEVPAHWDVLALGKITLSKCDGPFGSGLKSEHYTESGVKVIRLQNIKLGKYSDGEPVFIDEDYYRNNLRNHDVLTGDVLIAGLGDPNNPVGRACVAPIDISPAMVKADCFRFRLNEKKATPEFIALQLSISSFFDAGKLSNGSTRARIPLSLMATRYVAISPLEEQEKILCHIEQLSDKYDALEKEALVVIQLLQERRTALISAAVTGKIDVRNWQAPQQ